MVELSVVGRKSTDSAPSEHGVPFQPASLDIWDRKYRLKNKAGEALDADMDGTRERVARALADVEQTDKARAHWYGEFLWALRHGAIPAGRILSNAGAQAYKPETSTINCTVSGTIPDSMDGILTRLHEAGITLKGGSGIGYEFSTLRPRGGYVSGADAYTSGPLSFMDIYDSMCFTVSSAGGRRGAQMATFDVGHPDVMEFIRAKREHGRLRQFNLSLLITDEFMQAVRADAKWPLAFPLTPKEVTTTGIDIRDAARVIWRSWPMVAPYVHDERGKVACRIYRTIPARELWDAIMRSTYDFAEPGFVLVDRINEFNNNWFCENIRATNPCVTADTRLATQFGIVQIGDLARTRQPLLVTVDRRALGHDQGGTATRTACPAFLSATQADVFHVSTVDGYEINATGWHEFITRRGKVKLRDLQPGDELLVQSGKGQFGEDGNEKLGMLLGLITGDGHFTSRGPGKESAVLNLWNDERVLAPTVCIYINALISHLCSRRMYRVAPVSVPQRNLIMVRSVLLARALQHFGFTRESKLRVPEVVWRGSEACVRAYLRALFQTDGTVNVSIKSQTCSIRLASSHEDLLKDVQILLANFGAYCSVRLRREAGLRILPDGKGGRKKYAGKRDYELIIDGESRDIFMREIGFLLDNKNDKYRAWVKGKVLRKSQRFATRVKSIEFIGKQDVYDTTQPDNNTVIFNGLATGQCGEQPLPPYGACLLGSVNLTEFVEGPFTDEARFDWEKYRHVVHVFTRMLDNVVELHGLPLPEQGDEIRRKRRHGMGFLGLGSTLAMLGLRYGSRESVAFTEQVSREMAVTGWQAALELAKEKGPAPIMDEEFTVTASMLAQRPEMAADGINAGDKVKGRVLHARYGRYMQRIATVAPELVGELAEIGARFTHHSSIAPTGTISLSMGNNASNGIEPTFAHHYFRNVIREGKKTKERVDVWSYELLAYRHLVDAEAAPGKKLPDYFVTTDDITPRQHVDIQAAAQKWVDSSISKTVNVPGDMPFDEFKDVYLYACEQGLKGCTTFRFNPEAFQGVLVKEKDLKNTYYRFQLENGEVVELRGDEEVEYDGEVHTAANLYDALKEGYFGRF